MRESGEPRVLRREGEAIAVLMPLGARLDHGPGWVKTTADRGTYLASAGGWTGVDVDQFLKDSYESRRLSTRPPSRFDRPRRYRLDRGLAQWSRPAVRLLHEPADDYLAISLVTDGEIDDGVSYGSAPATDEAASEKLLQQVDVLPLDEPTMRRLARIRGALSTRGQRIGDPAVKIAATALHHDLALVTRNLDHLRRIPNLKLYDLSRPNKR